MSLRHLLWKDLRREVRSKEALQAGLVLVALFFVLDLFIYPDLSSDPRGTAVVLWTPILYASAAALGRGMASEADRGTLELLRSAPVPLLYHGISRTLLHTLVLALLGGITLGLAALIWQVPLDAGLTITFALAIVGLALMGSLTAGLAAQAQAREVLLPILLVPVLIPLLLAGVRATLASLGGAELGDLRPAWLLMVGYDLLAAAAAWLLWPIVMEGD